MIGASKLVVVLGWFVAHVVGLSVVLCLLHAAVGLVVAVCVVGNNLENKALSPLLQNARKGRSPLCAAGDIVAWPTRPVVAAWGIIAFGVLVSVMLLVGFVVITLGGVAVVVVVVGAIVVVVAVVGDVVVVVVAAEFVAGCCVDFDILVVAAG